MFKLQFINLTKETFFYMLGSLAGGLLNFLFLPVFTHYLSPQDYGVNALIMISMSFASSVFSLGASVSMAIRYFEVKDKSEKEVVIWSTFFLLMVNCSFLFAIGFFLAPWLCKVLFGNLSYFYLIRIALATLVCSTLKLPFIQYCKLETKARLFALITTVQMICSLSLSLYFIIVLGRGLKGLFESTLLTEGVFSIIALFLMGKFLKPNLRLAEIPKLIKLGYPSIFALSAYFVIDNAGLKILQHDIGVSEVGLYAFGYGIGSAISMLVTAFGSAWAPYYLSFIPKIGEARNNFGKVFKYYVLSTGIVVLLFFTFAKPVVFLMAAPRFHSAYIIVGCIAFAQVLRGYYWIFHAGFYMTKNVYLPALIEGIVAICSIFFNLILVPHFHKQGAAIALIVSYVLLVVMTYILGHKTLEVKYPWKSVIIFGILSLICASLCLIDFFSSLLMGTLFNGFLLFWVLFLTYFYVLNGNEKRFLYQSWKHFRMRSAN